MTTPARAALDAAMSEADVQRTVTEALDAHGWLWVHFRPARTKDGWRTAFEGYEGFPDIVAVRGGRVIVWELKSSRKPTRAERERREKQAMWLNAFSEVAGIDAKFVSPENLNEALAELA